MKNWSRLIQALSKHLVGGTEKNLQRTLAKIAGVPAQIRTEHFHNVSEALLPEPTSLVKEMLNKGKNSSAPYCQLQY